MRKNNLLSALAVSALCAGLGFSCSPRQEETYSHVAISPDDSPEDIVWKAAHVVPSRRQFEWQRLELTAFAHFGLNTFTDVQWGSGADDPEAFNPVHFDPGEWVSVLRETGFRSLILTCKHHDGFCLWPSAYTDYSVRSSPWKDGKGDVVRDVAEACHEQGLLFGVYLSPWDRHEQSYGTPEYNDFFVNQLTELLTQYGRVDEVWFDGACGEGPNGKVQEYDYQRWYAVVRELQPQAVIAIVGPDVRWVGSERGVGRLSEWSVVPNNKLDPALIAADSQHELIMPPTRVVRDEDLGSREVIGKAKTLVWYPSEADVSIRRSWFYTESDIGTTKSPERLLNIYFTSVGRNSNLLLNIPPNRDGLFGEEEVESLRGFAELRREMFGHNLLSDAKLRSFSGFSWCGKNARAAGDGNYDTSVRLKQCGDGSYGCITARWDAPKTFSVLMLQEDIRQGQRIESFTLQYLGEDGEWHTVAEGTTVGYKRLMRFDPVTATAVRLLIGSARHTPVIAEYGLF